jgi:hypothetical protein
VATAARGSRQDIKQEKQKKAPQKENDRKARRMCRRRKDENNKTKDKKYAREDKSIINAKNG